MTLVTRTILILTLMLAIADLSSAQEKRPATATSGTAATATVTTTADDTETDTAGSSDERPQTSDAQGSYEIRERFSQLLRKNPPELATILALDPTLLSNEPFLTGYPQLSRFVAAHPEVRRNPRFYLAEFPLAMDRRRSGMDDFLEGVTIFSVTALIAFALAWLVRTLIEQRRWNRLSRTQSEVHNKILDRFGTTGELLDYVKSPAGSKFLESAPIPLHPEPPVQNAPLARVLWSIQIGMVIAAAAIGMLVVSGRFNDETGQGLFGLGVIAFCIGAGFVGSSFASLFLSRRLGLWQPPQASENASADDRGLVR